MYVCIKKGDKRDQRIYLFPGIWYIRPERKLNKI